MGFLAECVALLLEKENINIENPIPLGKTATRANMASSAMLIYTIQSLNYNRMPIYLKIVLTKVQVVICVALEAS